MRPQSLAVHLVSVASKANAAYVGWTGLASSSSLAQWQNNSKGDVLETLEIDPQFATSLGFPEGCTLEIGLLYDLPIAKTVSAEPISPDDWEILELHADYVEDNLLSQVRVACIGQEVDVWVLGRTRVRFKILSIQPECSAATLSHDTEVAIAPKLRQRMKPPKRLENSSFSNGSDVHNHVSFQSTETVLRSFPYGFYSLPASAVSSDYAKAWVSRRTYNKLTGAGNMLEVPEDDPPRFVRCIRLTPPGSPLEARKEDKPESVALNEDPKLLKELASESTQKDMNVTTQNISNVLPLGWSHDIPDHHALIWGLNEVKEWDVVLLQSVSNEEVENSVTDRKGISKSFTIPLNLTPLKGTTINLWGIDKILKDCCDYIFTSVAAQSQIKDTLMRVPGLLLSGRSGCGRTSVMKAVASQMKENVSIHTYDIYVDLTKYNNEKMSTVKSLFQYWFDLARWHRPSILMLDNIDTLMPAEVENADSFRSRCLTEQFLSIFGARTSFPGVVIMATCTDRSSPHSLLLSSHVFSQTFSLKPPDRNARRDILAGNVSQNTLHSDLKVDPASPLNFPAIATQTEGYLAADLADLVTLAIHKATARAVKEQSEEVILTQGDFDTARQDSIPISLKNVRLPKPEVLWADIGGLHETRRVLRETLEWPTKYAAIFSKSPLRLRSGLLLYGYPGCGKTLLASAVAKECDLNFISVKGPELLNKYIGASEKSVRDIFDRATAAKPCVLFFDEFESIAPKRGHDSTGVTDRVVNQLLTQMDGAEGLDGVYILAATSRPDLIDPALLRPGRLDKSLLCDMPNELDRKEIMQVLSRKISIGDDVDLDHYAKLTEGFSGADLQALLYNAHLEVVHSTLDKHENNRNKNNESVSHTEQLQYEIYNPPSESRIVTRAEQDGLARRLPLILSAQKAEHEPEPQTARSPGSKEKPIIRDAHLRKAMGGLRPSVSLEERMRLKRIYDSLSSGKLPVPGSGVGSRTSLM